ncbi:NnrU family protein [Telmatospirillum sp. J64-1]|uniref:NnrU family protein n=1 Tax=Telmatospirillum sp. J64-1 TaxID=2502183 RepID=UPI00115CCB9C|nr:NnrU family protein [Telmatospirillum sp. J64-1]
MFTASLTELSLAALAFTGGHFLLSSTPLRGYLAGRLGEKGFLGVFSLLSLAALAWLILSYRQAPYVEFWMPAVWSRHLSLTFMPVALVLFAGSLRRDNPTATTGRTDGLDPNRLGIFAVTRHPMMWGTGLWAGLHLLANGDAASLILFGGILVLALGGTVAIDRKLRRRDPLAFARLAAVTSNLPFAAVLAGRNRLGREGMLWPVAIGLALYALLIWLHPLLFGPALIY